MQFKHFILALCCASLWGLNFPLIKIVALEMPPILSVALRLGLIGMCAFFVKKPHKEDWIRIALLSFTLFTFTLAPTTVAIRSVDASIAAFLNELEVPFAAILGFFLLREKLTRFQLFGMLLAFIGVYFIVESPEISYGTQSWAIFLLLVAAFFYGFSAVYVKFIKQTNALTLTVWSSLFASIELFLISSLLFERGEFLDMSMPSNRVLIALFLSAFISLFSFFLWNYLLKIYRVNQVVPFGMLLPIFSLIFSYYLLGETTHVVALLGGGLTLVGVWFQSYKT